jgi:hypothetical protein
VPYSQGYDLNRKAEGLLKPAEFMVATTTFPVFAEVFT